MMDQFNHCRGKRRVCEKLQRRRCATLDSQKTVASGAAEPGLSLWNRSVAIETRSLPALARSYPRRFTFYLGNPFPRFGDQINQSEQKETLHNQPSTINVEWSARAMRSSSLPARGTRSRLQSRYAFSVTARHRMRTRIRILNNL
jgi:hypothetical protein